MKHFDIESTRYGISPLFTDKYGKVILVGQSTVWALPKHYSHVNSKLFIFVASQRFIEVIKVIMENSVQ